MIATVEDLASAALGDYRLLMMAWTNAGQDFVTRLKAPAAARILQISFIWATGVRVEMDFGSYSGEPLLFDAKFERLADQSWQVRFEFGGAPDGMLHLLCNDVLVKSFEAGEVLPVL